MNTEKFLLLLEHHILTAKRSAELEHLEECRFHLDVFDMVFGAYCEDGYDLNKVNVEWIKLWESLRARCKEKGKD